MERFLVAVDEDQQAPRVIEMAGRLAQASGAALTVCHVMSEDRYRRIEAQQEKQHVAIPFSISAAELQAQELASGYARELHGYGVPFDVIGRVGDPAPTIVALAREAGRRPDHPRLRRADRHRAYPRAGRRFPRRHGDDAPAGAGGARRPVAGALIKRLTEIAGLRVIMSL